MGCREGVEVGGAAEKADKGLNQGVLQHLPLCQRKNPRPLRIWKSVDPRANAGHSRGGTLARAYSVEHEIF